MFLLPSDKSWSWLLSDIITSYQSPPRLSNVYCHNYLRSHDPASSQIISVVSQDISFTLFLLILPWSAQSRSVSYPGNAWGSLSCKSRASSKGLQYCWSPRSLLSLDFCLISFFWGVWHRLRSELFSCESWPWLYAVALVFADLTRC